MHHRLPVSAALTTAFYAAPQEPGDARRLFDAGCAAAGFGTALPTPIPPSRAIGSSLVLAREWELTELEERLAAAVETSYEPTWDRGRGEFTWGLGLDEPHPRGQFNAFLAAAEAAGPGRWEALSAARLPVCPQVVDVDFPTMAFSRAEWVDGNLRLRLAPLREDSSATTTFRLVGAEPRSWDVHGPDGVRLDLSTTGLTITVPLVAAELDLIRGSY